MTEEGKTALSHFLNLVSDFLSDGHARFREYSETVEKPLVQESPEEGSIDPEQNIPLAYLIEEEPGENLEESAPDSSVDSLEAVAMEIAACKACGLAATRKNVVPGEGSIHPLVMVIGEGPGADEDAQGRPFVGRAGQLLDRMLASIGLFRDKNCYIANMVKCRPPGNRDPAHEEMSECFHFLERQILLLRPKVILCAGRVAAQNLLKTNKGLNSLRGEFIEIPVGETFIPVLSTYHPSAILRDESYKRPAWEDLKLLRSRLDSSDES